MSRSRFSSTKVFWPLRCLASLSFVLVTTQVHAQGIAFDAASNSNTGTGTVASLTWAHTVGSLGVNRILIVGVSIRNASSQTVSSVTYNGTNLTLIGQSTNSTNARVEIWRLIAPATGAHNVVVTLSAAARFVGGATSFTGVSQTASLALGSFFAATGNTPTPTVSVTSVLQGQLVIDTIANANLATATAAPCAGAGQTQRWTDRTTNSTAGNNTPGAGSTEPGPAGGGTVAMTWKLEGCSGATNRQWAAGAVALKQGAVITLNKSVSPSGNQQPGTDIAYTVTFTNSGDATAQTVVITDPNPLNVIVAQRVFVNVDYKLGSASISAPWNATATIRFSNNAGASCLYTPVSGGNGAPVGYDRAVTNICWALNANVAVGAGGTINFTVRIR
jgi:uncharacterized repeat protein (TIGR01451 family)